MTVSARRAATRERIIAAALEIFGERGVPAASVEEIAERAGFTRGAFYSNFDSKADLCATILELQAEQAAAAAQRAVDSLDNALPDDLSALVEGAVQLFLSTVDSGPGMVLATAEMRLMALHEPEMQSAFAHMEQSSTPFFVGLVAEGLAAHGARLTVPIEDAIVLMRAVYDYAAIDQMRTTGSINQAETGRLMSVVLRGLIAPLG